MDKYDIAIDRLIKLHSLVHAQDRKGLREHLISMENEEETFVSPEPTEPETEPT